MGMVCKTCNDVDPVKTKIMPFTLQYLTWCFIVFEEGKYDSLYPHLRNEPEPYPEEAGYTPIMWCFKLGMRCERCNRLVCTPSNFPEFYKEYFVRHNTRYRLMKQIAREYDMRLRICRICEILRRYPLLENHPPRPFPKTRCKVDRRRVHFKDYRIDKKNRVVKLRYQPYRTCLIRNKCYRLK